MDKERNDRNIFSKDRSCRSDDKDLERLRRDWDILFKYAFL